MFAAIRHIEIALPETVLDNEALAQAFPDWTPEKILEKTGIRERRIVGPGECSSDLAVAASEKLFSVSEINRESVDYILLCTQSPDYLLPTTACLIQHRLGLRTGIGALDFNLGCSGYVAGLGLAKGLIESGQARMVLLLTAETYSKFIHPKDKSVRTLFGDAASATVLEAVDTETAHLGPFVYGTDGRGGPNLMVPTGGMREPTDPSAPAIEDANGNIRTRNNLFMNGAEIFSFTLKSVPKLVSKLLETSALSPGEIDHYVFHQANEFMLEALRKKIQIPPDRFPIAMAQCGNTVSSSIPIVLKELKDSGKLKHGQRCPAGWRA